MKPVQVAMIEQLYHDALRRHASQRAAFLAAACGADPALLNLLESLLEEPTSPDGTLTSAAWDLVSQYLQNDALSTQPHTPGATRRTRPADDELIGATIDRYVIVRRIGSGGMGVVYEAEQAKPRRRVALKLLGEDQRLQQQLDVESEALGRLEHPGIARIYEARTAWTPWGPEPFFAMEYVAGTELTEYVEATTASIAVRIEIIRQVLDAIHYAHGRGLVHRDLKPANILVVASGQPKILDFGIALFTGADNRLLAEGTQHLGIAGTLHYMSPEQTLGDWRNIDGRSDVYAAGVILYELMARRKPYAHRELDRLAVLRAVQQTAPEPIAGLPRPLLRDMEAIIGKALCKNRDERYQTAQEFADDLSNLVSRQTLTAEPGTILHRFDRWASRGERIRQAGQINFAVGLSLAAFHVIYSAIGFGMAAGLAPVLAGGIDVPSFLAQNVAWALLMGIAAAAGRGVQRGNRGAMWLSLALVTCLMTFTGLVWVGRVSYTMGGALDGGMVGVLYMLLLIIGMTCAASTVAALRASFIESLWREPPSAGTQPSAAADP